MEEEIFNKYYNQNELKILNRLLTDTRLNNGKLSLFRVGLFIEKNDMWYEGLDRLNNFLDNIEDNEIEIFNDLISNIERVINMLPDDNEDKKELYMKLMTIFLSKKSEFNMNVDEYYDILKKVLGSDKYSSNVKVNSIFGYSEYKLLSDLFQKNIIKDYPDKFSIVVNTALHDGVSIVDVNSFLFPTAKEVINNKDLLQMDNDYYKKAIKLTLVCINSYLVLQVLSNNDLTMEKKMIVIDYYTKIFNNLPRYWNCGMDTIEKISKIPLYNIVLTKKFIDMDIEDFKDKLNIIINATNPFSTAYVLSSSSVDPNKETLLINTINSGPKKNKKDITVQHDYKENLAIIGSSTILNKQSLSEYERIIKLINNYCVKTLNKDDFDNYRIIDHRLYALRLLFETKDIYDNDYERVLFIINKIISYTDKPGYRLETFRKFYTNKKSINYTLEEIERIYNLIMTKEHFYCLDKLFTNIVDLDSKEVLFDIAERDNKEELNKANEDFDKRGRFINNKNEILKNVSNDLLNQIYRIK